MVQCAELPRIKNTLMSSFNNTYNSTVDMACLIGYEFPQGATVLNTTCMANGQWSKTIQSCTGMYVIILFLHLLKSIHNMFYKTTYNEITLQE